MHFFKIFETPCTSDFPLTSSAAPFKSPFLNCLSSTHSLHGTFSSCFLYISLQSTLTPLAILSDSVQFSHWLFVTPWLQNSRLPCPSPTPGACSNSWPSSRWCHVTISSSDVSSSCFPSFPASGSFQMSQFFRSGGQSIGVSTSASVLPMNSQDWFSLGWTF